MVKLYEVGVVYKEDTESHRESELLVFNSTSEAEDYIRRGALKALFTMAALDKLTPITKKFFNALPDQITGEMIDKLSQDDCVKLYDIMKKFVLNPTVDKFFIEEVIFFEDPNGNKYPFQLKEK
jgi:hypothetical protein